MKTVATVISAEGDRAVVAVKRTSACEGCHKSADGGCSVCTLMGGESKPFTATAENRIGARAGDRVAVETATGRVLLYAAMVFLLPILLAVVGWLIAAGITEDMLMRLLGAVCGFAVTFGGLAIYSAMLRRRRPDAVIVEILTKASEMTENQE